MLGLFRWTNYNLLLSQVSSTRKRRSGPTKTHESHVLVHPDSIWTMLEAAREKNCSLSVVAKLRSDEVQGGAQASSVEYWNRKVLGIYSGRSKLGSWIFHTSTWWLMLRLTVKKKQLSAYVTLTRWTVVLFARFNMSLDPKSLPHLSLIWSRKSRFWPPHAKLNVWLPTGF